MTNPYLWCCGYGPSTTKVENAQVSSLVGKQRVIGLCVVIKEESCALGNYLNTSAHVSVKLKWDAPFKRKNVPCVLLSNLIE